MRIAWIFLLLASSAFAQDADHAGLAGKWQTEPSESDGSGVSTLNLEFKDGGTLHFLMRARNGDTAEFECGTEGQECNMTDAGRKAKVSAWFNGLTLVIMETRGNIIVKRTLTANGRTVELEVIPIVPPGKNDKLTYNKLS